MGSFGGQRLVGSWEWRGSWSIYASSGFAANYVRRLTVKELVSSFIALKYYLIDAVQSSPLSITFAIDICSHWRTRGTLVRALWIPSFNFQSPRARLL